MEIKYAGVRCNVNSINTPSQAHSNWFNEYETSLNQLLNETDGIYVTSEQIKNAVTGGVLYLNVKNGHFFSSSNMYSSNSILQVIRQGLLGATIELKLLDDSLGKLSKVISTLSEVRNTVIIEVDVKTLNLLTPELLSICDYCRVTSDSTSELVLKANSIINLSKQASIILSLDSTPETFSEIVNSKKLNKLLNSVNYIELKEVMLTSPELMTKYGTSQDLYHLMDFGTDVLCPVFSRLLMFKLIQHLSKTNKVILPITSNYIVGVKLANYITGIAKY